MTRKAVYLALFHALVLTSCLSLPTIMRAQGGYALDFDGSTSYAEIPYSADLNPATFTIEAWAKVEGGSGSFRSVITSRKAGNPTQGFMLYAASDNTWQFWTGDGGNATWDNTLSGVTVVNEWTHIAASFDGTSVRMYINGELKATTASTYIPNGAQALRIGAGATEGTPLFFFPGKIDEVRIWSDVRTQSEIQANMHKALTGSEANLEGYYQMSDGTGATLTDNSTNSNDATLTSSPAWKTSAALAGPGMALDFDGSDDYVNLGYPLAAGSNYTLEAWVNASTVSGNRNILSSNESPFWISSGTLRAGVGGNFLGVSSSSFPASEWVHVAVTFDDAANTMHLYKNGVLVSSNTNITNSFSLQPMYIGAHTGTGPGYGAISFFQGQIDEVRIWDDVRTEAEIRAYKDRTLDGTEANLVAYYRCDQQPNASHTTLHDLSGNGYNGTLSSMDAATDWVASTPFNTWIGSEGGDWTNAENWSLGSVPSGEDVGIFPWAGSSAPSSANISGRNFYVAAGNTISHSGNLTLSGDFYNAGTFATSGTATFSGSAAQAIRGTGATTFGTLIINNSTGVTTEQNLTTSTALTLTSGALSIGAYTLTLNGTISQTSGSLTGGTTSNIAIGEAGLRLDLPAVTLNNLSLDRAAGSTLTGNVTVNGTLTLTDGVLNVGANTLTFGSAATVAGSPGTSVHVQATSGLLRKDYSGTGSFTFPIGDGAAYSPITLDFSSGSFASGYTTVSVTNAKHPSNVSATDFLNRYWTVSSSGITGFSCDVSAQYADGDINGTESAITGGKYSSGTWTDLGPVTTGSNLITGTVSGFSDFTGGEAAAFPVEWLAFEARAEGGMVRLDWATASEQNSDFFAVERSSNRLGWETIGLVDAAGNSSELQEYGFDDLQPLAGKAWYRLRQVDIDGGFSFSNVVEVSDLQVARLKAWPNPVQQQISVEMNGNDQVTATLTDLSGRELIRQVLFPGAAVILVQQLPAGMYLLHLQSESGSWTEQKIMKQ